jgi:hypothetical protein
MDPSAAVTRDPSSLASKPVSGTKSSPSTAVPRDPNSLASKAVSGTESSPSTNVPRDSSFGPTTATAAQTQAAPTETETAAGQTAATAAQKQAEVTAAQRQASPTEPAAAAGQAAAHAQRTTVAQATALATTFISLKAAASTVLPLSSLPEPQATLTQSADALPTFPTVLQKEATKSISPHAVAQSDPQAINLDTPAGLCSPLGLDAAAGDVVAEDAVPNLRGLSTYLISRTVDIGRTSKPGT